MIGILAGNGGLPVILAKKLHSEGRPAVIASHFHEADESLHTLSHAHTWVSIGALKAVISFFKKNNVTEVVFVGGIKKSKLYKTFRPDLLALQALFSAKTNNDDSILRSVLSVFEKHGFVVKSVQEFLPEILPQKGVLTSRTFSNDELTNIEIGLPVARALGAFDVGQAIFVCKKSIVAVEAVEGTDEMLNRVSNLGIQGGVLIKISKSTQDTRVDLPTIGVRTIERLVEIKATALLIEAQKTLLLEPEKIIQLAEKHGIAIEASEF